MAARYCQVLLPLRLKWIPFYSTEIPLLRGQAVRVTFSGHRYTGIVWRTDVVPTVDRVQRITDIERSLAPLSSEEMKLWEFIADYYLCTLGEVFSAALPSLRLQSEQAAEANLTRLRARLSSVEAKLEGKHCERVRQRLEASRDGLLAEIRCAEASRAYSPSSLKRSAPGKPVLLRGYSRTSVYIKHIRETLERGGQALLLTPEKAFCDRLEDSLRAEFGDALSVVSSDKTPVQRRKSADRLRSGEPALILGTRSAVFLPYNGLSLVIIDEEQDSFYKQSEPSPRYSGRDTAIYLAGLHGAQVMLGSACPSLESLLNCSTGKYALQETHSEPGGSVEIIDINAERRKNGMRGVFSRKLMDAAAACGGPLRLIRGWEKPEELSDLQAVFPGIEVSVSTLAELKRDGAPGVGLLAVLQADALLSKDDFRSDERALQMVAMLSEFAPRLIIQSAVPQRFSPERDGEALLGERKQFGFPPYTRLVEVRRQGSGEVLERHFLRRDASLAARKAEIFDSLPDGCYADVDPQ
jgi:primosomal protein N'